MIRNRTARRALGFALIVLGGVLMWAATSPLLGTGANTAFQVHNMGEVWASALLEVRARLIARLGVLAITRVAAFVLVALLAYVTQVRMESEREPASAEAMELNLLELERGIDVAPATPLHRWESLARTKIDGAPIVPRGVLAARRHPPRLPTARISLEFRPKPPPAFNKIKVVFQSIDFNLV